MKTGKEAFEPENRAAGHRLRDTDVEYTAHRLHCGNCPVDHKRRIIKGPDMGGEPLWVRYECLGCTRSFTL